MDTNTNKMQENNTMIAELTMIGQTSSPETLVKNCEGGKGIKKLVPLLMDGQNIIMKTEKEATSDLPMTKEIPGKVNIMMQDDLHSTAGALGIATAEVLDIARTEANQRPEIRMVSKC